jgi:CubicO group peptidase (beta-lactamase class C family)
MKPFVPLAITGMILSVLCCTASSQVVRRDTSSMRRADGVERNLGSMYFLRGTAATHAGLQQRMTDLHVPGVTIAAIHEGRVDWARGYGVAAVDGPAVTPETVFAAESMSKPVTALAVLKLYEQHRIALDRNVNDYLKRWKLPASHLSGPKTVTIRQLLNHTSGIGTHNGELYDSLKPLPTLLNDLDGVPPSRMPPVRIETTPGAGFHYANGGYEVLQLVVEDVTGESFSSFVSRGVLKPAGMTRSGYDVPLSDKLSAQAATAYLGDHAIPPRKYYNPSAAAGGLWSTATDMAKLLIELQQEYDGKSSRILKQSTIREMLAPGPQMMPGMLQGLGIVVGGKPGAHFMEHGGSGIFHDEMVAYFQGKRDGLVVMANGNNAGVLVEEVLRSAAAVYGWPDFRQESHPVIPFNVSRAGKFLGDFGPIRFVSSPHGFAVEMPAGNAPERVYRDGPDHFFVLGGPQEFFFSDEVNGRMQAVRFVTPMVDMRWRRSDAAPAVRQK